MSLLTIIAISLEVLPTLCHRLITNPYSQLEWDSVIVSSDPITVREKTQNSTTALNPKEILRPQKRSYECPENDFACLYGNGDQTKDGGHIVDKFIEQYVNLFDGGKETERQENDNSRKAYWTMIDSQTHNHPFDDKKGWVTLEPVPWSTSKISKWHPNRMGIHQPESGPWDYVPGPTTQRPVQQFWVSGSSFHPERPSSQWGIGTNDIITDNKPSDFPTGHHHGHVKPHPGPSHQPESRPLEFDRFNDDHKTKGGNPPRLPEKTHPFTYPSKGNGEWVLLSTTKGYSHPQRHRWGGLDRVSASRKIKPTDISKYHEEDLNEKFVLEEKNPAGNRKSDEIGGVDAAKENGTDGQKFEKPPLQVLYTGSSGGVEDTTATYRRKVRLQVLPSLDSSSTSHGGLLEVDSHPQTVDEAQQEEEKTNKLKAIANVKKNKIRGFKLVPTIKMTGKGMNRKNVMTLAAVGAGMIPATMALLVPMALGRRKRSLSLGYLSDDRLQEKQRVQTLDEW